MKYVTLALVLFLFGQVTAQDIHLTNYKSSKMLNEVSDQDLVCGYLSLYIPKDNKKLVGEQAPLITSLTSNFDGSFFKKYETRLPLDKPISREFIAWADKAQPGRLIFKPIEKDGETVYKIVGYSKKWVRFEPRKELFPEFEGIKLINFDLEENQADLKKMKLMSGSLGHVPRDADRATYFSEEADIHYATTNFGPDKGSTFYVSMIKLSEPITVEILDWARVYGAGDFLFEKVKGPDTYKLVGYTSKQFMFQGEY